MDEEMKAEYYSKANSIDSAAEGISFQDIMSFGARMEKIMD